MVVGAMAEVQPMTEEAASLFKALAHPYRLMICCQLLNGPIGVGEIETLLDLKQPNLSRELAKLRNEGIVAAEREGSHVKYRIEDVRIVWILEGLRRALRGDKLNAEGTDLKRNLGVPQVILEQYSGSAMFARTISNPLKR